MSRHQTLVLLTVINLFNYIDRWMIAAVIPSMQTDLSLSNTQAGMIMSAFMLGYFMTSPFFGYLADRANRIFLVTGGTVVWSVATFVSGWGRGFLSIAGARTAVGVGEASTVSAGQSLIGDLYSGPQRNQVMAFFTAAIPVGAALGFVLGGILEHHWGWRVAFFVSAAPGLILAALLMTRREPSRGGVEKSQQKAGGFQNFAGDLSILWKNKSYVWTVFGYTAYTFTLGGFASWAAAYLVKVRGVPLHEADTLFGAITVLTGTAGSLAGGFFSAKALRRTPYGDLKFVAWTTAAAIPFAFGAFMLPQKSGFLVCIALTEFLLFLGQPAVNVVIIERAGPFLMGTATALSVFTIHLLGDFLSPTLVGFLADHFNLEFGILILPTALVPATFFYWRAFLLSPDPTRQAN